MIGLIQRVSQASVSVNQEVISEISAGGLLLLGIEAQDTLSHAQKLAKKLLNFRMFNDDLGKMNLNIEQAQGALLIVSQFTLVADTQKGNRPGFSKGASHEHGLTMYNAFIDEVKQQTQLPDSYIATGQFGADMQVALINDGPVTFTLTV